MRLLGFFVRSCFSGWSICRLETLAPYLVLKFRPMIASTRGSNMRKAVIAISALALTALSTVPTLARDYHHVYRRDYRRHHDHVTTTTTVPVVPVVPVTTTSHNWNWERNQYRHHWNKVSREHQRELDADLRQQWLAYHHNRWHGNTSWSSYQDPRFLDYLHTSNPTLLTRLRTYVGF
jgi:hypothetical protein